MAERQLRERLIHAATALFAERGFAGTSVREIVQAAGATKPTLYYYFESKEGLLSAVLEHHQADWVSGIEALHTASNPVLDRLQQWMADTLESSAGQRDVVLFLIRCQVEVFHGALDGDLEAFHKREHAALRQLVEEGIQNGELREHDPDDSVCALMGMLRYQLVATLEGREVPQDAAKRILAVYLKGVGT